MCTPFQFPYLTQKQLRDHCPSKQHGKSWKNELAYRDQCLDVIQKTCAALNIKLNTQERAIILLHRYFTVNSSTECTALDKWAHAVACVFMSQKLDSVYHRLESVVHSSIVELRKMQQRQMEPEYFNPDGTPGNAAYLASLAEMVRRAEMNVLFAVNFSVDISVPTYLVAHHLRKLGLTDDAEMQYPDLAEKVNAVRREALQTAAACCGKGCAVVLMHPAEHISMAAIFRACKANRLQWYLGPPPGDKEEKQRVIGEVVVPDLPLDKLKAIAADLPRIAGAGSSLRSDPQQNDGHGCFRSRGGRWLSKPPSRPALVKFEGGIRLNSNATDSSNGEAGTNMQQLGEPSPSPDSANSPTSAPGSSSRSQRHVTFGELPPSVALLQAKFRQRAAVEEKYRRERSPEPCASLDSDQEDFGIPQQLREQQRQAVYGQLKRVRDESVGLATGSDEEDSAVSRPLNQELELDCAGSSSKRVKVAVC